MTTRRVTDQQFVNGSAIDANRIQRALTDIEGYANNVPLHAISKRFSMNYLVLAAVSAKGIGGQPTLKMQTRYSPFLSDATPDGPRVKGTRRKYGPSTVNGNGLASAFVWSVATLFPRPVIIDTVSVYIDSGDDDTLGYMHMVDPGVLNPGDLGVSAHRVRLIIDTDDVIAAEDRTLNSKEYTLQNFEESNYLDAPSGGLAALDDMFPASPIGAAAAPHKLWLVRENIDLPLHQFARTKFRLVFYGEDGAALISTSPPDVTFTIAYKEALIEG